MTIDEKRQLVDKYRDENEFIKAAELSEEIANETGLLFDIKRAIVLENLCAYVAGKKVGGYDLALDWAYMALDWVLVLGKDDELRKTEGEFMDQQFAELNEMIGEALFNLDKNNTECKERFELAIENGNNEANYDLGVYYLYHNDFAGIKCLETYLDNLTDYDRSNKEMNLNACKALIHHYSNRKGFLNDKKKLKKYKNMAEQFR